MKTGQIIFNTIGLFFACMFLIAILSTLFIVAPEDSPEKRGWWYFLMAYESVLLLTIGGGPLVNFTKRRLCGWPTGVMIAGYFISVWLIPLAIWGIVLLAQEQRRQRDTRGTKNALKNSNVNQSA